MSKILSGVLAACMVLALASCDSVGHKDASTPAPPTSTSPGAPVAPPAVASASPASFPPPQQSEDKPRKSSEIIRGSGRLANAEPPKGRSGTVTNDAGDITLDFVNADIKDVARAVFQDLLKVNYSVDPRVQGTITIQTSQPLKREAVMSIFEETLKMNGFALLTSGQVYQVVPAADAVHQGGATVKGRHRDVGQPGYGVEILSPHFISAADLKRLLEPMAPAGAVLQLDSSRNILMIAGSEQERSIMIEDAGLFDVDWMSGMSFALFSPRYASAQQLTTELGQLLGGKDGPLASMVRLVPIERLNVLLALSPQARYLDELKGWVERLDQPGDSVEQRIFVYRVQNGRAADLAGVLTKALGISSSTGKSGSQGSSGSAGRSSQPTSDEMSYYGHGQPGGPAPAVVSGEPPASSADQSQGIRVTGLANVSITADEVNNALIVLAAPKDYAVVEAALKQLDIVPLQVFLEASIAEVTLNNELKYGVQYFLKSKSGHNTGILTTSSSSSVSGVFPGFNYIYSGGNNTVILNALEGVTKVDVVSSPQVMVLNNQTATLQVGDQVPITTQQATNVVTSSSTIVNSIQYRDTGVILKVTPRVNQGGMVMLDVSQEVSAVSTTTSSSLDSPTIQQRKLSSSVAVRDGETVALGGLIKTSKTKDKSGIPLLKDIPLLGNAFSSTDNVDDRTELLVLITPHVVNSSERAQSVTDELRAKISAAGALVPKVAPH